MSDTAFIVRPLPGSNLKGAFRVHISPDALSHLQLKLGEVCYIVGEDGTRGAGIAWRAADKMGSSPKSQPIKMSEILRDTVGFKQGTQVRIEKSDDPLIHAATKVMLIEVTPNDYDGPDDDRWKNRCIGVLTNCEAIAVGTTFDVSAGEGLKKRYYVEHIETTLDGPILSYFGDSTDLQILDGPLRSPGSNAPIIPLRLDDRRIGGLQKQVEALNTRLDMLCSRARSISLSPKLSFNRSVLIHGYQGTGKSLLLNELARVSGLKKIVRLDSKHLRGSPAKNESIIQAAFREAQMNQPSLVLIDKLDQIAPASDDLLATNADYLASAFDSTLNTQTLLICTARSINAVHGSLLEPGRLTSLLELSIPDTKARQQILSAQLPAGHNVDESILRKVASLTHGFTGADLARVVEDVIDRVSIRMHRELVDWMDLYLPESTRPTTADTLDSRTGSIAPTLVERPTTPIINFTLVDFENALKHIRPSALREIIIDRPKVTFRDIGGSAALRSRFDRIILWPTEHAEMLAAFPETRARRGVLLYGPPGCSKTMTAQAVASSYNWNFIAVKGAELISMYVGESERALREIFRKAKQAAPTIIFFDEIDSIASARSSTSDASKSLNVVTTLLNEMDGFETISNVLVLAATNKPQALDAAILRPGRFDEHIYLGPPDDDARLEILDMCVRRAPGGRDINLQPIVAQTQGMSGAEIKNAWQLAKDLAFERNIVGDPLKIIAQDLITGVMKTRRGITKEMLQEYEEFANGGK